MLGNFWFFAVNFEKGHPLSSGDLFACVLFAQLASCFIDSVTGMLFYTRATTVRIWTFNATVNLRSAMSCIEAVNRQLGYLKRMATFDWCYAEDAHLNPTSRHQAISEITYQQLKLPRALPVFFVYPHPCNGHAEHHSAGSRRSESKRTNWNRSKREIKNNCHAG